MRSRPTRSRPRPCKPPVSSRRRLLVDLLFLADHVALGVLLLGLGNLGLAVVPDTGALGLLGCLGLCHGASAGPGTGLRVHLGLVGLLAVRPLLLDLDLVLVLLHLDLLVGANSRGEEAEPGEGICDAVHDRSFVEQTSWRRTARRTTFGCSPGQTDSFSRKEAAASISAAPAGTGTRRIPA